VRPHSTGMSTGRVKSFNGEEPVAYRGMGLGGGVRCHTNAIDVAFFITYNEKSQMDECFWEDKCM